MGNPGSCTMRSPIKSSSSVSSLLSLSQINITRRKKKGGGDESGSDEVKMWHAVVIPFPCLCPGDQTLQILSGAPSHSHNRYGIKKGKEGIQRRDLELLSQLWSWHHLGCMTNGRIMNRLLSAKHPFPGRTLLFLNSWGTSGGNTSSWHPSEAQNYKMLPLLQCYWRSWKQPQLQNTMEKRGNLTLKLGSESKSHTCTLSITKTLSSQSLMRPLKCKKLE